MTATVDATAMVAVPKSELARGLRAAAAIKAKHVHVDLVGEQAHMTAFTPEVAVDVHLDAQITQSAGSAYVPRQLLASVLAHLEPDIRARIADDQLVLEADGSTVEINAARPKVKVRKRGRRHIVTEPLQAGTFGHDFPAGRKIAEFEAPTLVEVLRRALPSASRDQTRPVLATVALYPASSCAAATDSYRLAIVRYGDGPAQPEEEPILLHVDAALALRRLLAKKLGKVTITATKTHYLVQFEDTRWSITRLPAPHEYQPGQWSGRYPSWWNLLPDQKPETIVKVDREDLLSACRAAVALAPRNGPLRLTAGPDGATVMCNRPDVGRMTRRLPSALIWGESMEIGFNPEFMADICQTAPVERLTIRLIGPLRPALVEAARDQYLLMPIRLNV